MGYPMKKLIFDDCGGIPNGLQMKAVIPGGSSVPIITPEEVERCNLDYESIAAVGSMLGLRRADCPRRESRHF
jgi:NADH-quinone oxidoreductase subunit F